MSTDATRAWKEHIRVDCLISLDAEVVEALIILLQRIFERQRCEE
jgi:hypothetical protein